MRKGKLLYNSLNFIYKRLFYKVVSQLAWNSNNKLNERRGMYLTSWLFLEATTDVCEFFEFKLLGFSSRFDNNPTTNSGNFSTMSFNPECITLSPYLMRTSRQHIHIVNSFLIHYSRDMRSCCLVIIIHNNILFLFISL